MKIICQISLRYFLSFESYYLKTPLNGSKSTKKCLFGLRSTKPAKVASWSALLINRINATQYKIQVP